MSEDELQDRAAVMLLAMRALADALWKAHTMEHDDVALVALKSGAAAAREILRET